MPVPAPECLQDARASAGDLLRLCEPDLVELPFLDGFRHARFRSCGCLQPGELSLGNLVGYVVLHQLDELLRLAALLLPDGLHVPSKCELLGDGKLRPLAHGEPSLRTLLLWIAPRRGPR